METQTHFSDEVIVRRRVRVIVLGVFAVLLGMPVSGEPKQDGGTSIFKRKAARTVPVAYQNSSGDARYSQAPAVSKVAPRYPGIPRAKIVRIGHRPAVATPPVEATTPIRSIPPLRTMAPAPVKVKEMTPPAPVRRESASFPTSPSTATLVQRCDIMALKGLVYKFGADDPLTGGLDCSGAVQYLLRQEGIRDVPRTAYTQYQWLKKLGTLNKVSRWSWSADRVARKIRPGDLMFWTGTYNTGKSPNISHVMIYLGRDAGNGKHYMFGASSRRSKGIHGNAVDVYEFTYPRKHGKDNFAGFGSVPGLRQ